VKTDASISFPTPGRKTGGFSLVEVALALGIMAFSMIIIFGLLGQVQRTARDARLEAASAILFGQAHSQLRSPFAWTSHDPERQPLNLANLLGPGVSLSDVAAGTTVETVGLFDETLAILAGENSQKAQFEVLLRAAPVSSASLEAGDPAFAAALPALETAQTTVAITLEISHPALAPTGSRSVRRFAFLSTRPSP